MDLEVAKETNPNSLFNTLDHIKGLLEQERKPTGSLKYYQQQKTKWHHLRKVYENCTSFEPSAQPPVNQVVEILNDPEAQYHNVFPLAVRQGSALEHHNKQIVERMVGEITEEIVVIYGSLGNDGTNSCAFLCTVIGDLLMNKIVKQPLDWKDVALLAEKALKESPSAFNHLRDKQCLYDCQEASNMLWKGGILQCQYEVTEEIISSSGALTKEGKCNEFFDPFFSA